VGLGDEEKGRDGRERRREGIKGWDWEMRKKGGGGGWGMG
jgi:hypothetical protein